MRIEPIRQSDARRVAERHGLDWHYRETTESTNADVLRHYAEHRREVVAVSEAQSAGRGRRGREWVSPYARNIYCTIGLNKSIDANRQGLLSIVTGLALCRALKQEAQANVALKWPNDLLADGEKLGGILIESRPESDANFFLAIGFGINVFMQAEELAALDQPATSLHRLTDATIDRTGLLGAVIAEVTESIREFDTVAAAALVEEFSRYDAYHGQTVEVTSGERQVTGINLGISTDGQLQLQTGQGVEVHAAAEISLRPLET